MSGYLLLICVGEAKIACGPNRCRVGSGLQSRLDLPQMTILDRNAASIDQNRQGHGEQHHRAPRILRY
jgi:hypothetical protein